jgi:membrane-associated phospholipid phosphatase
MTKELLDASTVLILFLQNLGSWLIVPMQWVTALGNEEFYLFVAPLIYWCLSATIGLRLGIYLMVSGLVNAGLKFVFHSPRPFWYDSRVHALASETSFGIPSGHSQNAVVVWGALASSQRRGWGWAAAAILTLLIGISRLVLGVHFLSDIVLGWLIGIALLWTLLLLERPFLSWYQERSTGQQILIALEISLGLVFAAWLVRLSQSAWTVPAEWLASARLALPDILTEPFALSGLVSEAGALFGLASGAILLYPLGGFSAQGPLWKRAVRFPIGVLVVALIWFGLGAVFPRGEYLLAYGLRYLRYALLGLWITGGAPWLFIRLHLAQPATVGRPERQKLATQPATVPD